MIEQAFISLPEVHVEVYEPKGAPEPEAIVDHTTTPRMTPGRAALLGLMRRYLGALMDTSVSLLEIHKLMYFLQETGEPLRLDYAKAPYGPYAKNLRHVLNRIEGHFVTGYGDAEDRPDRKIELRPDASERAEEFLKTHEKTRERLDRVGNLISGFETPYGMELLSSVHWVAKYEGADSPDEALARTYEWAERKKMFKPDHLQVAWRVLQDKGWLKT
jgi:O-acetyl-ADP-ribose deacetylase (regulator of RNase III)